MIQAAPINEITTFVPEEEIDFGANILHINVESTITPITDNVAPDANNN